MTALNPLSLVIKTYIDRTYPLPNGYNPTQEEKYMAALLCKNLCDLCETGIAIRQSMKNITPSDNLPEVQTLKLCQQALGGFYNVNFFKTNSNGDLIPNWKALQNFEQEYLNTLCSLYNVIDNNMNEFHDIKKNIQERNKIFFLQNYDKLFVNSPLEEYLGQFKNFIKTDKVSQDDQDYVWEYFDAMIDLIQNKDKHIKFLKRCK